MSLQVRKIDRLRNQIDEYNLRNGMVDKEEAAEIVARFKRTLAHLPKMTPPTTPEASDDEDVEIDRLLKNSPRAKLEAKQIEALEAQLLEMKKKL